MMMMICLFVSLLIGSSIQATRQRLPDEIIPASAEHSLTHGGNVAALAIDLNIRSRSYTQPGSDGKVWLKVNFAKLNCIHQVIWYDYYGNPKLILTCTSTDCSSNCTNTFCSNHPLTISAERTSSDGLPLIEECKYGDAVKIESVSGSYFGVYEIAITGKQEAKCETLDSAWSKVLTDPTLPVEHGVEITFTCPADLVNKGGNKATCLYGQLVPNTTPPQCSDIAPCRAGQYLDQSTGCQNCPADHWSEVGNTAATCTACPSGKGVASGGGTQASDCTWMPCNAAGQYLDQSTGCQNCPADHWSEVGNTAATCTPCPSGKGVASGSGTQESDCTWKPCLAGQYLNQSKGCQNCPADHWSAADNTAATCTPCPSGKGVASGAGTQESDCTWKPCLAGLYLDQSTGCQSCPADHWSEAANKLAECTACPSGKGVDSGAGTQESDCVWNNSKEELNKRNEDLEEELRKMRLMSDKTKEVLNKKNEDLAEELREMRIISDQREKADRAQQLISWNLVGVFATSTILLSIFIIWRTCCQKKSSPETTEAEPEYIDNVLQIPVKQ